MVHKSQLYNINRSPDNCTHLDCTLNFIFHEIKSDDRKDNQTNDDNSSRHMIFFSF